MSNEKELTQKEQAVELVLRVANAANKGGLLDITEAPVILNAIKFLAALPDPEKENNPVSAKLKNNDKDKT